jgi:DNA polymerase
MLRAWRLPSALTSARARRPPPRRHSRRDRAPLAVASSSAREGASSAGTPWFASHEDLVAHLRALRGDPLESDGGRVVVHRGVPTARIMIVGEAPGAEEDARGVPYVGRAGQLLDRVFAAVRLDTNRDCYVTNVAKRRPANNRDPTAAEIAYYRAFLEEEIRLVDPAIVVLTGRHATRALLGADVAKEGISKIRGRWRRDRRGRRIMPMFHPSYLLRNPQKTPGSPKALTWDDVREVRRVADELGLLDENARVDAIVESDAEAEARAKSETRDETTRDE